MKNINGLIEELDVTLKETDEAFRLYADARRHLSDVKAEKYEQVTSAAGEEVFVPLEALMTECANEAVLSGQFVSKFVKPDGTMKRSTKEEREEELAGWLRQNDPAYAHYAERLQNQAVKEVMAQGAAQIAETNYTRLHTKVMALRGQVDFFTANQTEAANLVEVDREARRSANLAIELQIAKENRAAAEANLSAVKLNVQTATEGVRKEMMAEMEQYKNAVQPFLDMARSLKALDVSGLS